MMSLTFFFYMSLVLFSVIGAMRGWAKELLVSFGVILSISLIVLVEKFVPIIGPMLQQNNARSFWIKIGILGVILYFSYQTPNFPLLLKEKGKFERQKLPDTFLGLVMGLLNGYLIAGTIWYYMNQSQYPFPLITPPVIGTPAGDAAARILKWLPPAWLTFPWVFAVFIIFAIFILVLLI